MACVAKKSPSHIPKSDKNTETSTIQPFLMVGKMSLKSINLLDADMLMQSFRVEF